MNELVGWWDKFSRWDKFSQWNKFSRWDEISRWDKFSQWDKRLTENNLIPTSLLTSQQKGLDISNTSI